MPNVKVRSAEERWLSTELDFDELRSQLASVLYFSALADLVASGTDALRAGGMAMRRARVAVYGLAGWSQREIGVVLCVSERTVKSDVAAVRRVLESGVVYEMASRRLPKVPLPLSERRSHSRL